jgi:Protein of unknown function (DUF1203)
MVREYGEHGRSNNPIRCAMSSFRLIGLPFALFSDLFALPDAKLLMRNVRRVFADAKPGYPCRVSLADADIGDELLLLPYEHQPAKSPYKSSGPIFVRRGAAQANIGAGVVPDYVRTRLISVRAYDEGHLMTDAVTCAGTDAGAAILHMLASKEVAYVHLHNANRGCFSCTAVRA